MALALQILASGFAAGANGDVRPVKHDSLSATPPAIGQAQ